MKPHKFIVSILSLVPLCACQSNVRTSGVDDYRHVITSTNDTFSVLQLTDIHWCYATKLSDSTNYLTHVLDFAKEKAGQIDLVVITGDSFLGANQAMVTKLYSFIDSWDIPFAVTYGNHDKEGDWGRAWMNQAIQKGKNAISLPHDDDNVDGDTNYFVDWNDGNDTIWRFYLLDSNSLILENAISYGYDGIHENQVQWMKTMANQSVHTIPSLGFMHIPPKEFGDASKEAKADRSRWILGEQNEKTCESAVDSSFVTVAKSIGMRGVFFGHDHSNDFVIQDQDGFTMGYGVKSGTELYYHEDETSKQTLTGGALYTVKKDDSYDLEHLYVDDHEGYPVSSIRREGLR